MRVFPPPYGSAERAPTILAEEGFCVLDAAQLSALCGVDPREFGALRGAWERLPLDAHLLDGGQYRRRRHGSFVVEDGALRPVPQRAHWQPREYNALHGGLRRWFEPLEADLVEPPVWGRLLVGLGTLFSRVDGAPRWFVEAHPFRIDTTTGQGGIGRPTPEGAHRDGVDFVALILVERHAIRGGETRVFQAEQPAGQRFTLAEPWSALLLDDRRVVHESTPIQPEEAAGHRDTLVLTFRSRGFQEPA